MWNCWHLGAWKSSEHEHISHCFMIRLTEIILFIRSWVRWKISKQKDQHQILHFSKGEVQRSNYPSTWVLCSGRKVSYWVFKYCVFLRCVISTQKDFEGMFNVILLSGCLSCTTWDGFLKIIGKGTFSRCFRIWLCMKWQWLSVIELDIYYYAQCSSFFREIHLHFLPTTKCSLSYHTIKWHPIHFLMTYVPD